MQVQRFISTFNQFGTSKHLWTKVRTRFVNAWVGTGFS